MSKSKQQQWNEEHPDVIHKAQKEYNQKRPIWSFRPTPENIQWLEKERWEDDNGKPESDATLLNRKLDKLRLLEQ